MALAKAVAFALCIVGQSARFKRAQSVTIAGVHVHNYQPNNKEWIVLFKAGASDGAIKRLCKGYCNFQGHPSEKGMGFAKIHGDEAELESLLTDTSAVDFIERDVIDYMIPEIEVGSEAGALVENGESKAPSWGLDRIGVSSAATTGKGVYIYVQDTGIRTSHGDFGGRAASALDMSVDDGKECGGAAGCAGDRQGHGSHCAGSAAGKTFGVAPDAKLFAVKTLSDQGSGARSWQYAGIDYVATKGKMPAVLSMSLGGNGKDAGYDAAFAAAIDAGVVAVVAAGNSNSDTCNFSPAFSKNAITVGATDKYNKRASYSNFGTCNDIMAPGSAIVSVSNGGDSGSKSLSGTSMACPHVSGAAALLLETDPSLSKDQILKQFKAKALNGYISGLKPSDPDYFLYVGTAAPPPPVACRRRLMCL